MSTQNDPVFSRRAWGTAVVFAVLVVLLAVSASAAVVLGILHFSPRQVGDAELAKKDENPAPQKKEPLAKKDENPAQQKKAPSSSDELVQNGAVKVEDVSSTTVFYPIPFASSPHLTLTTKLGGRKFVINRQDELGFTWSMPLTEAEVKGLGDLTKIGDGKPPEQKPPDAKSTPEKEGKPAAEKKPNPGPHEFAWEARGVREKAASPYPKPHEQKGSFTAAWGQEGEVYFSAPYATPPNVSLGISTANVSIQKVSPLGFSWKNPGSSTLPSPTVTFTSLGVKATAEQVALLAKEVAPLTPPKPPENPLKVVEQKGQFTAVVNQKGEVYFSQPYASPPNVVSSGAPVDVIITQVTPTGFKWQGIVAQNYNGTVPIGTASWTAKGVLATSVPTDKVGK